MYKRNKIFDKYISVSTRCRPVRIAYLIEDDDNSSKNITDIFSKSYSRWGGRYTLIVPVRNATISEDYWKWLTSFDPDIIYTFNEISKELIEKINRTICPMHFEDNKVFITNHNWLKCESVISENKLATYYEIKDVATRTQFALNNFGKIHRLHYIGSLGAGGGAVNDESELLDALTDDGWIKSQRNLSSSLCELSSDASHAWSETINLFVGDSFVDRISFWNSFLSGCKSPQNGNNYSLIISKELINNTAFISSLANYVKNANQLSVKIRSGSLSASAVEEIIKNIENLWGATGRINFERISDVNECANRDYYSRPVRSGTQKESIQLVNCNKFFLVFNVPSFINSLDNKQYNNEEFILSLDIERSVNYSELINRSHHWRLPNIFQLATLFFDDSSSVDIRIDSNGIVTCNSSASKNNSVTINIPDDEEIFSVMLHPINFFHSYDLRKDLSQKQYFDHRFSDKGRYLMQFFNLFGGVGSAFNHISCEFWRSQFIKYSNSTAHETIKSRVAKKLKNKVINNDDLTNKVTSIVVDLAQFVKNPQQAFTFSSLLLALKDNLEYFITNSSQQNLTESKEEIFNESKYDLERSMQYLISNGVITQGYEIPCSHCRYVNWISMDKLSVLIPCQICNESMHPPVADGWLFRLNENFSRTIREHGIIPQVLTLAKLCDESRSSFCFIPPIEIYVDEQSKCPTTDIDLFCIQDGDLVIGEIKSSDRDAMEVDALCEIAMNLKPNKIIVSLPFTPRNEKIIDEIKIKINSMLNSSCYKPLVDIYMQENFESLNQKYDLRLP